MGVNFIARISSCLVNYRGRYGRSYLSHLTSASHRSDGSAAIPTGQIFVGAVIPTAIPHPLSRPGRPLLPWICDFAGAVIPTAIPFSRIFVAAMTARGERRQPQRAGRKPALGFQVEQEAELEWRKCSNAGAKICLRRDSTPIIAAGTATPTSHTLPLHLAGAMAPPQYSPAKSS